MKPLTQILATAAVPLVFGVLGCHQHVTAVNVPGTHCNSREHECAGGGCCSLSDDCGGIWPNCPINYCCAGVDDGRLFGGARGERRMTKQRFPTSE